MKNRSEKIYKEIKETEKKNKIIVIIIIKKEKKNALRQADSQLLQAEGGMEHMQRISTWTVFKGEPVSFKWGARAAAPPARLAPTSLRHSTLRHGQAPQLPALAVLPWQGGAWGGHPGQAAMPRGRGAWFLVCGFWVSLCRETTAPFSLFRDARCILREEDGRTPRAGSVMASFIPAHP